MAGTNAPQTLRPLKLLISGAPKIGKSTVVDRLVQLAHEAGHNVGGFVTHERRGDDGRRIGFAVQDMLGHQAVIAHVGFTSEIQVGRFFVDVTAFERIALPALERAVAEGGLVVVDEIARMELASAAFVRAVEQLMDSAAPVVATVHAQQHSFTDALKQRPDIEQVRLTEANRDEMPRQLLARLTQP